MALVSYVICVTWHLAVNILAHTETNTEEQFSPKVKLIENGLAQHVANNVKTQNIHAIVKTYFDAREFCQY